MPKFKISIVYLPFTILILGLLIAQVIGTIQVYRSNIELHAKLKVIDDSGYLTIPNQRVASRLLDLTPAVKGGVFYSLSIGAGLSLFFLLTGWIWARLLSRNKFCLLVMILIWLIGLLMLNLRGFDLTVTLYFLALPPVCFGLTIFWLSPAENGVNRRSAMVHVIPVILLALLWTTQADSNLFIDLRDYLLLSNRIGTTINDFYYNNTLYAAEAFKSLNQKLLKTCKLQDFKDKSLARSMERVLLRHDYLPVKGDTEPDLKIVRKGQILMFMNRNRTVLQTSVDRLLSDSKTILQKFSSKVDRHAVFRQMTFYSLLMGFPIALYIILHALFCIFFHLFFKIRTSAAIASLLCFTLGLGVLIFFHFNRSSHFVVEDIASALNSKRWQERVAALRMIEHKAWEIGEFSTYTHRLNSPFLPERYWLVRVMAVSRRPQTYAELLLFLKDFSLNVRSMAFYALGRRGEHRAIDIIINEIRSSEEWYSQWYGYQALRTLGWKQSKSS